MTSEVKFGTWNPALCSTRIDYSLSVLEEIRDVVADGFQKIPRGMEVAGLLFGSREETGLRIQAMRPIDCEHAFGPSFRLSDNDKRALDSFLAAAPEVPRFKGLEPVGWFVSHPRSEIALQANDLEIFNQYFPHVFQTTLVIRPGRGNTMRAGFFVRETDGTVRADRSYEDFNFPDRLGPVFERRGETRTAAAAAGTSPAVASERRFNGAGVPKKENLPSLFTSERALPEEPPEPENGLMLASDFRSFGEPPPISQKARKGISRVLWGGVIVVAAIAAFLSIEPLSQKTRVEPLGLGVLDRAGQLQIQWNRTSRSIASGSGGTLEIVDGAAHKSLTLDKKTLEEGSISYARSTGDVEVRLRINRPGERPIEEASRFLGSDPEPVAAETEALPVKAGPDSDRLRGDNERQRARIQQLERTLVIMQGRLGQDAASAAPEQ